MTSSKGLRIFLNRGRTLLKQPVFWVVTFFGHSVIFAGAWAYYYFEKGVNPQIQSGFDALYWAIATVTTVGVGEAAPFTFGGKVVGIAMMILGSLFLWSYIALFVDALIAPDIRTVESEVHALEKDVEGVEKEMKLDEKTIQELLREIQELRSDLRTRGQK